MLSFHCVLVLLGFIHNEINLKSKEPYYSCIVNKFFYNCLCRLDYGLHNSFHKFYSLNVSFSWIYAHRCCLFSDRNMVYIFYSVEANIFHLYWILFYFISIFIWFAWINAVSLSFLMITNLIFTFLLKYDICLILHTY